MISPAGETVARSGDAWAPTLADNTSEGLAALKAANARYRAVPWPAPFDATTHELRLGDARDLRAIPDGSVHLVVTSPPYWTLKKNG